nr:unnamed protein product [Callosobruchus analis]
MNLPPFAKARILLVLSLIFQPLFPHKKTKKKRTLNVWLHQPVFHILRKTKLCVSIFEGQRSYDLNRSSTIVLTTLLGVCLFGGCLCTYTIRCYFNCICLGVETTYFVTLMYTPGCHYNIKYYGCLFIQNISIYIYIYNKIYYFLKISGIEDGKRTVNSIKGIRRDSEVLYGGTLEATNFARRGRLDGVFNEAEQASNFFYRNTWLRCSRFKKYIQQNHYILSTSFCTILVGSKYPPPPGALIRSKSQPDFFQDIGKNDKKEMPSIFVRPGMGSIVIRKSLNSTFGGGFYGNNEESSIGSGESYGQRQTTDDELSDSESSEEEENPNGPLERFLTAFGLSEYLQKFIDQKIDLETLIILTESDLKSLNLPLGPYRKLVNAINERKAALENPGEVKDSVL